MLEVRKTIGKPEQRIDVIEKATGTVRFIGDFSMPNLAHAKLVNGGQYPVRSPSMADSFQQYDLFSGKSGDGSSG